MATTAILSALAQEQQGLLGQLTGARQVQRAGRDFWLGDLHGAPVVLALSRIGKVAAATTATTLIEAFGADRIVFTGVAGALGPDVRVGDVVVASHFVQHDMDASPLFPRFEIPLYRQAQFACDPGADGSCWRRPAAQRWPQWQQRHANRATGAAGRAPGPDRQRRPLHRHRPDRRRDVQQALARACDGRAGRRDGRRRGGPGLP